GSKGEGRAILRQANEDPGILAVEIGPDRVRQTATLTELVEVGFLKPLRGEADHVFRLTAQAHRALRKALDEG
ncbi:hypothetical protein WDZ92_23100, partial [Nostoc sp. NIES-2111]